VKIAPLLYQLNHNDLWAVENQKSSVYNPVSAFYQNWQST